MLWYGLMPVFAGMMRRAAAWLLLEEAMRNDPATYPSEGLLAKLEAGMPIDAEGQQRRSQLWQEIRQSG